MIGIISAMTLETEMLINKSSFDITETITGIDFHKIEIGGKEVVLSVSGVGKVNAARVAEAMILTYNPDFIINTGVAGGLNPALSIGDIVLSEKLVQHDMDTSALGDPVGMISGINMVKLPASQTLCEKIEKTAERLGIPCARGVIASGDQFIADRKKKEWIRDTFDAIACEMEGAAIGQACYANGVAFAVLRAISDNADDAAGTMDYPTLCERAAKQTQRLIEAMLGA